MKKKFSKFLGVSLALVLVCSFSMVTAVSAAAAVTEVWVDDGWSNQADVDVFDSALTWDTDAFDTIQEGITAVDPGGTVNVAAGAYAQDLVISAGKDNLELAGADGATIKGVVQSDDELFPYADPNIDILAPGVKIHGFTIEGPGPVADKYASGMLIGAPGVEIYLNDFKVTAGKDSWSGGAISTGIVTYRKTATAMENVDISGLNIHDNTFTSLGTGAAGFDGIFVNLDTGTGSITIGPDNKFTGNFIRAITVERSNAVISGNSIITDLAPYTAGAGSYKGILIGCFPLSEDPFEEGPVQSNVSITGNTVKGSGSGKGFTQGIRVGHSSQLGLEDITVSQNVVEGNTTGIRINPDASGVSVNYNGITGNTVGVQNDDGGVQLDATMNWWGSASGPTHASNTYTVPAGDAQGNAVSDYVVYVPWCNIDKAGDSFAPVKNVTDAPDSLFSSIQAAIDDADTEAADTISVAVGTYSENITIDRTLTLEGAQAGEDAFERTGPESIIDAQLADFAVFIIGAETVATLDGFTVLNYEVGGILAGAFSPPEDDPLVVHILNNVVEAPSPLEDAHNNNIQMGDGTTGMVIGNEVSGAHLEHPDWSGSGIIVASTNGVLISNNHAYSCDIGIAIIGYTHGGRTPSEGNIIEYNDVESCGAGIGVQRQSIGTIIRYNDVSNNDAGIESAGYPDDVPSGTEVHYNNIVGNLEYGVASIIWGEDPGVPEEVDATLNWWGDPSGPDGAQDFGPETYTGVLPGTGDSVSGNVKCQPWLTRPFKTVLEDDIAYFGISSPALKGWNIVSAPLALDENVIVTVKEVEYTANTWGGLQYLGKIAEGDKYALKLHYTVEDGVRVYSPIYYYDSDLDSVDPGWRMANEFTEINPVDAFYIRMMESDSIPILFSPDRSVPSKELYKGWNLVGCAYMSVLTEEEGLALETALATIESVSSSTGDVTGYDQVVSPSMNQPSWTYIPSSGTYIPESVEGDTILIGKGYWVFMENPGTLAGLTFTPISLPK